MIEDDILPAPSVGRSVQKLNIHWTMRLCCAFWSFFGHHFWKLNPTHPKTSVYSFLSLFPFCPSKHWTLTDYHAQKQPLLTCKWERHWKRNKEKFQRFFTNKITARRFGRFLISPDKLLCSHLNLILRTILGPASISQPEPRTPFVWGYFSHPTPIHLGDRSLILEIRSSFFLGKIILTWSEERK